MLVAPRKASELPESKLVFLMPPYIYRGVVTMISGPRSSNKSTLAAYMTAKLSRGQNPFSLGSMRAGTTLWYSREDDVKRVTAPRIEHFGGADEKVHYGEAETIADTAQIEYDFKLTNPDMVIVDSLSAFFVSSQGEKRINLALKFLRNLAEQYNCALIIIHHPTRDPRTRDDFAAGADRIKNDVRVAYFVMENPERKDRRFFTSAKYQYGKDPYTMQFRINHVFQIDKMTVEKHLWFEDVLKLRRADRNHCAVRALAAGARIEYQKADWIYREAGRERWRGTACSTSEKVLKQFGTHTVVPKLKPAYTLGRFLKEHPTGNYVVSVRNHQLAVNNGEPSDSSGLKRRVEDYWKLFK